MEVEVGVAVGADLVTLVQDPPCQPAMPKNVFADDEESGAALELGENVEDSRRSVVARPVVEAQADQRLVGLDPPHNRTAQGCHVVEL